MNVKKGLIRQKTTYKVLAFLIGRIFCKVTRFTYVAKKPVSETFVIVSNHTMDLDPIYNVLISKSHFRFVATGSLLRGFTGALLRFFFGPIPRYKGASPEETISLMKENLMAGISVGLYPEGNKTWDGETCYFSDKLAKLVKETGVGLVTTKIAGGYLHHPRWAKTKRKGNLYGEFVNEYTKEQIAEMSVEEIYAAMVKDLYVNVYEEPALADAEFKGKDLAENLPCVTYICPSCHSLGTISAKGDEFSCSCELKGRFTVNGRLASLTETALPFDNTVSWNRWQKQWLKDNADAYKLSTEEPLFKDYGALVSRTDEVEKKEPEVIMKNAEVLFYGDRIELVAEGVRETLQMAKISAMGAFRASRVYFTHNGVFYELRFDHIISGMKYISLWRVLSGRPLY